MYYDQIKLLQQGMQKARGLLGDYLPVIPVLGQADAVVRAGEAAGAGNYAKAAEAVADVVPVGRVVNKAIKMATRGKGTSELGGVMNITKDQFLGKPKITSNKNASSLVPRELTTVAPMQPEPFKEGMTAKYSPDGATVYDESGKPIASYNFGDTLVVDKKNRGRGVGEELVYQWRTRYPDAPPAKERTKASQALQEKVWARIERDRPDLLGIQGGLLDSGMDSSLLNRYETDADRRMAIAQRNAALPVEQGGLGLPADNTPQMRAKAMGYVVPGYHGTDQDIAAFDPNKQGAATGAKSAKAGTWVTDDPRTAASYANYAATDAKVARLVKEADKLADQGKWDAFDEKTRQAEELEASISMIGCAAKTLFLCLCKKARARWTLWESHSLAQRMTLTVRSLWLAQGATDLLP